MADELKYAHHHEEPKPDDSCAGATPKADDYAAVDSTDRGLFGFGGKKEEEKCEETVIAAEFEQKVQVCEEEEKKEEHKEETKHEGLLEKLQRSNSSSCSVSLQIITFSSSI